MSIQIVTIAIETDGSGNFSVDTPELNGKLVQVQYDFGGLAATLDLTVTGKKTGMTMLGVTNLAAADARFAPRQPVHDNALAAMTYDGTRPIEDFIYLAEAFSVVVAQGGTSVSGELHLFIEV